MRQLFHQTTGSIADSPPPGSIERTRLEMFAQIVLLNGLALRISTEGTMVLHAVGLFDRREVEMENGGLALFRVGGLPGCSVLVNNLAFSGDNPARPGSKITVVKPDYPGWPPYYIVLGVAADVR